MPLDPTNLYTAISDHVKEVPALATLYLKDIDEKAFWAFPMDCMGAVPMSELFPALGMTKSSEGLIPPKEWTWVVANSTRPFESRTLHPEVLE